MFEGVTMFQTGFIRCSILFICSLPPSKPFSHTIKHLFERIFEFFTIILLNLIYNRIPVHPIFFDLRFDSIIVVAH